MPQQKPRKNLASIFFTVVMFLMVFFLIVVGTMRLSAKAGEEGVAATRSAIERAAVLCYATEGFYPPSLAYLEENYRIQIDHRRYLVHYEVFSPKEAPTVRVTPIKNAR